MCNEDLRNEVRIANVKQWEVADAIGISEMTMVKWLRKELDPDKKALVRDGIEVVREKHMKTNNQSQARSFPTMLDVDLKHQDGESACSYRRSVMRDRSKQRANRRMKQEFLDMRNNVGILDPTPYQAVKNMVNEEKKKSKSSNKEAVA